MIDSKIPSFPGYHGRILEVNLSEGRIETRPLNPGLCRAYLGGRGLATRIFYDTVDPLCDPLDLENVIVIATSPLHGTNAATACRGHMVFKSPLTGIIGSSNSGGSWASFFKATGYDVLIIKGRAAEPVMLDISEERAELQPAGHLWGLDVHRTTEVLTSDARPGPRPRVLAIGPAGENMVRFAAVVNDKNRVYGRCGPGAVWGSKRLKAIRVQGKGKVQVYDKERYQSGLDQAFYLMKQAPITKRLLRELGTSGLVELINLINMLPHRNFQNSLHIEEDVEKISGETLSKTFLKNPGGCFLCPIGCQRHTSIPSEEEKGEGPEYETVVMMGPLCGIYDLEAITRANYRANELGMDTISFGGTLACAMELFERGALTAEDTAGLDLHFGNAEILETVIKLTAFRRGFGAKLGDGSWCLASSLGHPEYSMTVKKLEIPAYDPRASFTQALGYVTSPTGACHLRGGYAVSLAFFGGPKEIPRFSLIQSPIAIRNMQNMGILQDSLGVCRFTGFAFSIEPWSRMVSGVTGWDFSMARLEEVANRIATLERLFNFEAGMSPEEDVLPLRFSQEPIWVGGKEVVLSLEAMTRMRKDYYEIRGWDEKGRPTASLLEALGIRKREL